MGTTRTASQAPSAGRVGVVALILAALVLMGATPAADAANGQPWNNTTIADVSPCQLDASPQICDPAFLHKVRVPTGKLIKVKKIRYEASFQHCSSGRILIKLDGTRVGKTDWVNAGEDSTVEALDLTLRPRPGGKAHRFTYRFKGRLGGCNGGFVSGWGGEMRLKGTKLNDG